MKVSISRLKGSAFLQYGFVPVKCNGRLIAVCRVCQRKLQNTAASRLRGHRNICEPADSHVLPDFPKLEENELEHSTIDLKMELNENSDESLHEYSSQPEIDEMDLQRNSSKNSTNEETNFDDIAIDHNPLSPSNRRKSEPFEIDDIILEEDDIFLPKIQYVKEAIKENASPKFSRRLLSLHEEKTKAETIYFRKKAAYFQKQTDNLETQRKLMILQAQKLRLEIDQLRNDF